MAKKKKKSAALILVIVLILIALIAAAFILTPDSDPIEKTTTEKKSEEYDLEVLVIPDYEGGQIISHTGYTLCYSEEHEQPYWVAYVLTPWETIYRASERNDNFRADSSVNTGSASLSDYKGSGYDRGHLIPYADLGWSEEAASESFYLSNMSPQAGDLNRYAWADLEAVVRTFSLSGPICVVTGPVLSDGPYETIGENKVSVPKYFYKVIYSPVLEAAIAFVLPNEKCDEPLENYAVSVDYVENLTGIDFFSGLEEELENDLEGNIDVSVWDFTKYNSSVAKKYGYDTETGYKEGETEQTVAVNTQTEEIEDYYLLLQHYLYTYLWPAKQQIIVVVHSFGI